MLNVCVSYAIFRGWSLLLWQSSFLKLLWSVFQQLIKKFTEEMLSLREVLFKSAWKAAWPHCFLLHYVFLLGVNFTDLSSVKRIFYTPKNVFFFFLYFDALCKNFFCKNLLCMTLASILSNLLYSYTKKPVSPWWSVLLYLSFVCRWSIV